MVKLESYSCGYGDRWILESLDIEFEPQSITAISGKSGRGKSTILKAINRLHEIEESSFIQSGVISVELDGELHDIQTLEPSYLRRKVGYISQSPTPLPMSIEQNVAIGLKMQGIKDSKRVEKALIEAHLWADVRDRLHHNPTTLSIGQQQRLAIARVLVLEPQILLFDEPTSALDIDSTLEIEATMQSLSRSRTIILVTHDREQIDRVADRCVEV